MWVHMNAPTVTYDVCVCVQSSQCMWLMQALGFLLSALPEDQVLGRLHSLISPHIQKLETLTTEEVTGDINQQPLGINSSLSPRLLSTAQPRQ